MEQKQKQNAQTSTQVVEIVLSLIKFNPKLASSPDREFGRASTDSTYAELIQNERSEVECDTLNKMVTERFTMLVSTVEIITNAAEAAGVNARDLFLPIPGDPAGEYHEGFARLQKYVDSWSDIPFLYLNYAWCRALRSGLFKDVQQIQQYVPRKFAETTVDGNKVEVAVGSMVDQLRPAGSAGRSITGTEDTWMGWVVAGMVTVLMAGFTVLKPKR